MNLPVTDRRGGNVMFSGRPSASACVRASVRPIMRPVSTIFYNPMDGISPNFVDNVFVALCPEFFGDNSALKQILLLLLFLAN